jgi:adenylate cyclase
MERADQIEALTQYFKKFVPSNIAEDLAKSKNHKEREAVINAASKKFISILFLDIIDFTKISSIHPPETIVQLLRATFTEMQPLITGNNGFIDKFTGDGFLAVFTSKDSAKHVTEAASAILKILPEINEKLQRLELPTIQIAMGADFGEVILGTVGSKEAINFTVIGSAVNLAARLEAYTRVIGPNTLCVSQELVREAKCDGIWEECGPITVKGFEDPIKAFKLKKGADVIELAKWKPQPKPEEWEPED